MLLKGKDLVPAIKERQAKLAAELREQGKQPGHESSIFRVRGG